VHDSVAHPEQERDLETKSVWRVFFVGVGVTIVATLFATWAALEVLSQAGTIRSPVPLVPADTVVGPDGIEQRMFDLQARGLAHRRMEHAELERYGWIDRSRGLVRIPIDRAISLAAEQLRAEQSGFTPLPTAAELDAHSRDRQGGSTGVTRGGRR